ILPLCLLPMAIAVALATTGRVGLAGTLGLSGLALWLAVGATAIGVSGGAIDPRFESTADRRAVGVAGSPAAAVIAVCLTAGAAAIVIGLFVVGRNRLRAVEGSIGSV